MLWMGDLTFTIFKNCDLTRIASAWSSREPDFLMAMPEGNIWGFVRKDLV